MPSVGYSGGLLLGCNSDVCDVVSWDVGAFFISVTIKHRISLASWAIVCVYGPADHSRAADFLGEIQSLVGAKQGANIPIVLGVILTLSVRERIRITLTLTGLELTCSIIRLHNSS